MKTFEINPTLIFHTLRHFKSVNQETISRILGQEVYFFDYDKSVFDKMIVTNSDIQNALKSYGSKFVSETRTSPIKVLGYCKKMFELEIKNSIEFSKNTILKFDMSEPIGLADFVELSSITPENKSKIFKESRSKLKGERNIMVNLLTNQNIQPTNFIGLEVVDTNDLPFLWVSAYPTSLKEFDIDESKPFFDQIVILI